MGSRLVAGVSVALALAGCDAADAGACEDGAARLHVVGGAAYCVYPPGGRPDRAACPSAVPLLIVSRGLTLCTDADAPSSSRLDELCALPDVACQADVTGWTVMLGTRISDVCPDAPELQGVVGCEAVVSAWGGGVADTVAGRLLLWGGGGAKYLGNEVYALDVNARTVERFTEPSPITDPASCAGTLSDGRPIGRQTSDNLAFLAHAGRMFARAGFASCTSGPGNTDTGRSTSRLGRGSGWIRPPADRPRARSRRPTTTPPCASSISTTREASGRTTWTRTRTRAWWPTLRPTTTRSGASIVPRASS